MPNLISSILDTIAASKEDANALHQIKHKLESDLKLKVNLVKLTEIARYFATIENLQKDQAKSEDFHKNSEFYAMMYRNINNIVFLLNEFLDSKNSLLQEILRLGNRYKWKHYFFSGAYLIEDANNKFTNKENNEVIDVENFLNNHLKAAETFLKAIEECSPYLEQKEIDYFEQPILILLKWLEDEEQDIEKEHQIILQKIIVTAKAILWEINQVKNNKSSQLKPTVANLNKYLKSSSGWHGNDFEECLDLINESRRN